MTPSTCAWFGAGSCPSWRWSRLFAVKAAILYARPLSALSAVGRVEDGCSARPAGGVRLHRHRAGAQPRIVEPQIAQLATAVVGISMMLTPLLAVGGRWLARRAQDIEQANTCREAKPRRSSDHVIIAAMAASARPSRGSSRLSMSRSSRWIRTAIGQRECAAAARPSISATPAGRSS